MSERAKIYELALTLDICIEQQNRQIEHLQKIASCYEQLLHLSLKEFADIMQYTKDAGVALGPAELKSLQCLIDRINSSLQTL